MHVEAGFLAGGTVPAPHLIALMTERQALDPSFWCGAECRGLVNGVPHPSGIALQVGGDLGHAGFQKRLVRVRRIG